MKHLDLNMLSIHHEVFRKCELSNVLMLLILPRAPILCYTTLPALPMRSFEHVTAVISAPYKIRRPISQSLLLHISYVIPSGNSHSLDEPFFCELDFSVVRIVNEFHGSSLGFASRYV